MSSVQETPKQDFIIHIGAPEPMIIQRRATSEDGVLLAFDATLKCEYIFGSTVVVLGVGTGITLSESEGVADARATIQLSIAQSRLIPEGNFTSYEMQITTDGRESVFLMGSLIGEGGANPDA